MASVKSHLGDEGLKGNPKHLGSSTTSMAPPPYLGPSLFEENLGASEIENVRCLLLSRAIIISVILVIGNPKFIYN
jgi:hypothetical protein